MSDSQAMDGLLKDGEARETEGYSRRIGEIKAAVAAVEAQGSEGNGPSATPAPLAEHAVTAGEPKATPAKAAEQESKPDQKVAEEWARVLRQSQQLHRQQQEFKRSQAEWKSKLSEFEQAEALRQRDPLAYAAKYLPGDIYERMTKHYLKDPEAAAVKKVEPAGLPPDVQAKLAKIDELEKRLKDRDEETAVGAYMSQVDAVLAEPQYAITKAWPNIKGEIQTLVTQWHEAYGETLTPQQAVDKINAVVRQHWEQLKQLEGDPAKPSPAKKAPVAPPQAGNGSPAKTTPKTLTNGMTADSGAEPPDEKLSWSQAKERAAKLIQWS